MFDAKKAFKSKLEMPTASIRDIGLRDLVVVEAHIGRYNVKTKEEIKASSSGAHRQRGPMWAEWRAQFELRAISLLAKAAEMEIEDLEEGDFCI